MKYQQKDFTPQLKTEIQEMGSALKKYSKTLLRENKAIFENRNLKFYAELNLDGSDHFLPGSRSTICIGIADKISPDGELSNLHVITIWKCGRIVLGLPVSKNIPGSKIIGELVDETLKDLKEELKEYVEEFLSEEY